MKTSANGRYFLDKTGKPLFWLGDTQWELFRGYSLADSACILQNRKEKGFSFIQVMLLGVKPVADVDGNDPFDNSDPLKPGKKYFKRVDKVLDETGKKSGTALVIGIYHKNYPPGMFTKENSRAWAKWLAGRYRDIPHIVWSMYPESRPEYVPICRELAAGLKEGGKGNHLITVHPDPSPATSGTQFHGEDWLDFNSIQTFKDVQLIRSMVAEDYSRKPVKPVVMAEGAYEAGSEYGFEVTPLWVRRQAWYSYLADGHHSYGHNDSWRILPTWRPSLDAPGAEQMGILKKVFLSIPEWWELIPDPSLLAAKETKDPRIMTLACRHPRNRWIMIYSGDSSTVTVQTERFVKKEYSIRWIDPRSGTAVKTGRFTLAEQRSLTPPSGMEDCLAILE